MAERFQRCRFWPRCSLHLGDTLPRWFSPENYEQMREDRADGLQHRQIAHLFGTTEDSVRSVLRDNRTGRRAAPLWLQRVRQR